MKAPEASDAATASVDPAIAAEFIFGNPAAAAKLRPPVATTSATLHTSTPNTTPNTSAATSRVALNTRIREDLARALKRTAFDREMTGNERHTLQDIVEEAIEAWLRSQGAAS
ncbi:MAG TPA: hypothetical protein VK176_03150 [Phycisphaerales bacterium]|nr:hypothetical protein [Phycisphaerales bacterium]